MPSAPDYPNDESDELAEGLAFFNDAADDDDDEPRPRRPILELDGASALPVVVEEPEEEGEIGRIVDLDAAVSASGGLDLSALIGQFDAAQNRSRPTAPNRPAQFEPAKPTAPATAPVYDLASSSPEPVQRPADTAEIARLRELVETERNNVRRGIADLVNYRRKAEHDRERAVHDTMARVVKQFLPIFDDFERSLSATDEARSYEQISEGVHAILRNFEALLAKNGIHAVDSLGQLFDPDVHEAAGADENSDQPEDTVVEELRRGYLIDGRLLRAALVKIARKPSDGPEADAPVEPVEPVQAEAITDENQTAESGAEAAPQSD
jgi:molecular chaperone GrpE